MSDTVLVGFIGVAGGVITAFLTASWTVGGRSALVRRTIKQERELLDATDDRFLRRQLQRIIDGRIAVYVARFSPVPQSVWKRQGLVAFGQLVGCGVLCLLAWQAIRLKADADAWLRLGGITVFVISLIGAGFVSGRDVGRALLRSRAIARRRRFRRVREQLSEADAERSGRSSES